MDEQGQWPQFQRMTRQELRDFGKRNNLKGYYPEYRRIKFGYTKKKGYDDIGPIHLCDFFRWVRQQGPRPRPEKPPIPHRLGKRLATVK